MLHKWAEGCVVERAVHIAEVVYIVAALGFLGTYLHSEDLTYLLAAGLCFVSAILSVLLSWPWVLAAGFVLTAVLMILTAPGRRRR